MSSPSVSHMQSGIYGAVSYNPEGDGIDSERTAGPSLRVTDTEDAWISLCI